MDNLTRFSLKSYTKLFNPNYVYLLPHYVQTLRDSRFTTCPNQTENHVFLNSPLPLVASVAATAAAGTSDGHVCHHDDHSFLGAVNAIVAGTTAWRARTSPEVPLLGVSSPPRTSPALLPPRRDAAERPRHDGRRSRRRPVIAASRPLPARHRQSHAPPCRHRPMRLSPYTAVPLVHFTWYGIAETSQNTFFYLVLAGR